MGVDIIILLCYGIGVEIKKDKTEMKKSLVIYSEIKVWITGA